MRRSFAAALAALVLAIGAARAVPDDGGTPAALVTLAVSKAEALQPEVSAYGTVAPDPDYLTTVAIPRDGIVAAVSVRAGQLVKAGDAIATIETAPGAAASFQQAQSAAAFAAKDLAHTKALYDQQLATKSQLAAAENAYAAAAAQLRAQQKIGAGRAAEVLRANAPGIVTVLNASPGDRVQANSVLASIATRDRLLVNVGLEPEDAPQVPVGAPVWLRSPQDDSLSFTSTVEAVDAMMDARSRLVNAVVGVPQAIAPRLILGTVLEGVVKLPSKSGIVVPHDAIMTDAQGNYVYVIAKGVAHRRAVTIGLETDEDALLVKGLKAGERVVVAGNAGLENGTAVRTH
ncbi:MAG: efflux RND transporter periplasmic adaptor subunit [Alphaproteobacteria bacterium]|nr:efflux RND transporter periplasmic adaptor subunit [Alphaproteobacteria bacterium]